MTQILRTDPTPRRRKNLAKLADYLESLPEDYAHFDMNQFIDHDPERGIPGTIDEDRRQALERYDSAVALESTVFAASPEQFLNNCGTVACALGHGPAAGIPLAKAHLQTKKVKGVSIVTDINFGAYSKRFVTNQYSREWDFLFSGDWAGTDDHHWGAAARIRFLLDKGGVPADVDIWGDLTMMDYGLMVEVYQPYRVDVRCATST